MIKAPEKMVQNFLMASPFSTDSRVNSKNILSPGRDRRALHAHNPSGKKIISPATAICQTYKLDRIVKIVGLTPAKFCFMIEGVKA